MLIFLLAAYVGGFITGYLLHDKVTEFLTKFKKTDTTTK